MPLIHHAGPSSLQDVFNSAHAPDSTPASQWNALRTAAGIFAGTARSIIACTGDDRVRWLNGMVTQHVGALATHRGCYAFVLNAQGRIQGDLNIYLMDDALWLETDQPQADKLLAYLDHYIIMDDVTLAQMPPLERLNIAGPAAASVLAKIGISVADMEALAIRSTAWAEIPVTVTAEYSPLIPRYAIWIAPEHAADCAQALLAAGTVACSAQVAEQLRILEGTPAYGIDILDRDLPQETAQMRALHFSKGCYLGQEIVERIRSRGNVHRIFTGFLSDSALPVASAPAPERLAVLAGDQRVGEITRAAQIGLQDGSQKSIALGYIRREALEKHIALTCGGNSISAEPIPFTKIFLESRKVQ
jgi:folate-binding protein YgfZ